MTSPSFDGALWKKQVIGLQRGPKSFQESWPKEKNVTMIFFVFFYEFPTNTVPTTLPCVFRLHLSFSIVPCEKTCEISDTSWGKKTWGPDRPFDPALSLEPMVIQAITWNLKITQLKRNIIWTKPNLHFLSSKCEFSGFYICSRFFFSAFDRGCSVWMCR